MPEAVQGSAAVEGLEGFRLSPLQERLWRLQDGRSGSPFSSWVLLRIDGRLDRPGLARALAAVAARHEVLRTDFVQPPGMREPFQVIRRRPPGGLGEIDLRSLAPETQEAQAGRLLAAAARENGAGGAGLRVSLWALSERRHLLLLRLPALCGDAVTLDHLARETFDHYARGGAAEDEAEPPLQYVDFTEWQRELLTSPDTAEGVDRWRELWRQWGVGPLLARRLPFEDGAGPLAEFVPASLDLPLEPGLLAAAAERVGDGGGLADFFLACWQVVLWRSGGDGDVLIGVLTDGRRFEELEAALGPYSCYLPLHGRPGGGMRLPDLLAAQARDLGEARARQEFFSWRHLLDGAGSAPVHAFFPASFQVRDEGWRYAGAGLEVEVAGRDACLDRFKLELAFVQGRGAPRLKLRWDGGLFSRAAAELLGERLLAVAGQLARHPDQPLAAIDPVGPRERRRLLVELNPESRPAVEGTLWERLERQVGRTPERAAVVAGDEVLSFAALGARAGGLARRLAALGVGPERPVALCLERTAGAVVGILGVAGAGGAWLPLDPGHPAERLAFMVEDAGAHVAVVHRRGAGVLPAGVQRVELDAGGVLLEGAAPLPARTVPAPASPRGLAYVIYTSGSTGRPKGVEVEQRSPLTLLAGLEAAVAELAAGAALRVSLNAPLIFDASVQQLVMLLAGHTLLVVPERVRADGEALLAWLRARAVELFDCTPSQLRLLLAAGLLAPEGPAPRVVLAAGEAIDGETWSRLLEARRTAFYNVYGPTECTVDATARRVEAGAGGVSIGWPLPGYAVYLLDPALRTVPLGAPGELCVGGSGLARGYARRPAATAGRFVPHPFAAELGSRLYRTGDLGRHRLDGTIEFLGRGDDQVKLRGYRVELGEIEARLMAHPGVARAVALARPDAAGSLTLVAYVQPAPGPAAPAAGLEAELRGALERSLPPYMVPAAFMRVPQFPLTPSGKVDRRALPEPDPSRLAPAGARVAPRGPLEEILTGIWEEVLGVEGLGVDDDFFALGGHSLSALQIVARMRNGLDVEVSVNQLLERPTIAGLAGALEAAGPGASRPQLPPLLPAPADGPPPLSFAQQRLWFLHRLDPASPAYNLPLGLRLEGDLQLPALAAALTEVVRRHEVLRTTFVEVDGAPVQEVGPCRPVAPPAVDLTALADPEAAARRLARLEALRPFDLARGPLLRPRLLRLGEKDGVALLTLHHAVTDDWSTGVLVRELGALYRAFVQGEPSPLPDLAVQYGDFARWQRAVLSGEVLAGELAFWRRELAGAPPEIRLPTDHPRPSRPPSRGALCTRRLPGDLVAGLRAFSRRRGATPFMTLLAAFKALLARGSGEHDVVVGTPVAGRTRVELEGMIGFFVNTLVLRTDLAGAPSFADLVARVRRGTLAAFAHQDLPFEKLVEELQPARTLSRPPFFQAMLVVQNAPAGALELPGVTLRRFGGGRGAGRLDLVLICSDVADELACTLDYNPDLFEAATAEGLLAAFAQLLAAALDRPEAPVEDLPLLAGAERAELAAASGPAREYPPAALWELFAAAAGRAPDAVALLGEEGAVTRGGLERRAEALAGRLAAAGAGPEVPVGLLLERSPEAVAAQLGVARSGAAWVPLEPDLPAEGLRAVVAAGGLELVVTRCGLAPRLGPVPPRRREGPPRLILVDGLEEGRSGRRAPPVAASPELAAYVLFTSGSTGAGKGVVIPQRALTHFVRAFAEVAGLGPGSRTFLFAPLAFDASVLQVFPALVNGGSVALHPEPRALGGAEIVDFCRRHRVTVLDLPAALWRQWVDDRAAAGDTLPPSIEIFLTGGESVPVDKLHAWARLPARRATFLTSYGPTEATVTATAFVTDSDRVAAGAEPVLEWPVVPIGRPLPGVRVHVLDRRLRPLPRGVPGELLLAGPGLARGYLARPALTAAAFLPDGLGGEGGGRLYRTGDLGRRLPGGDLEFLGRRDDQVKVRGFRLEPAAVEAALASHPAVQGAVVLAQEEAHGGRDLVAYVVPAPGAPAVDLRRFLAEKLPDYMLPRAVVPLPELPLTPSGKVDRRSLPKPEAARDRALGSLVLPRTGLEAEVAAVWEELLGVQPVGVRDDFFALGGHSLLATRIVSRLERVFGVPVPLRSVFEAPTVAGLSAVVSAALSSGEGRVPPAIERVPRGGPLPPSFAQERLWFIDQLEPGTPVYNMPLSLRLEGDLSPTALAGALGEVMRRHEVLRTSFSTVEGRPVQVIAPASRCALPVVDLGGLGAGERRALARRLGTAESRRPFDLARGPVLRCGLVRLGLREHVLLLTVHHIAADGWSLGILLEEVTALYQGLRAGQAAALPELPVQYADFASWQRSESVREELERQLDYWRRQLEGTPPALELPWDRSRPAAASHRGGREELALPRELSSAARGLARREGATLFMALLAGFGALLGRYGGVREVAVGTPIANRTRPETERLVGFFVNSLVLRLEVGGARTFREILRGVRSTALEAYAHQDLPFERLVEALQPERDLSRTPLFQVMFAVEHAPPPVAESGGLSLSPWAVDLGTEKFDLSLRITDSGEGLRGELGYSRDLFDAATVRRLAGHLRALLERVLRDPEARLEDLSLLTAGERQLLTMEWHPPAAEAPAGPVHRWIARRAAVAPDAAAVVAGSSHSSYGGFEERVRRLAWRLRRAGVGPGDRVGIAIERSTALIVAILGVLEAGAAYLPLDPSYPEERLAETARDGLGDAAVPLLLVSGSGPEEVARAVARAAGLALMAVEEEGGGAGAEEATPTPADLRLSAYVIYTSGSTGRPKGVVVAHANLAFSTAARLAGYRRPVGRFLLVPSFAFDSSVAVIFWTLAQGGALVLPDTEESRDPAALTRCAVRQRISHWLSVPSLYAAVLERPEAAALAALRTVIIGGEACPPSLPAGHRARLGGADLFNEYGPTEVAVWCSVAACGGASGGRTVPIGRPIPGSRLYVVGRRGVLAPVGVPGELRVGGGGVALSYLGRPGATAERFVPDPYGEGRGERLYATGDLTRWLGGGELEFLGRTDHQVKVRGFRVELGEVERTLARHPAVREAAVVLLGEGERQRLVAYVAGDGEGLAEKALRDWLARLLPEPMLPAQIAALPILPRTPNGKLDRSALPALEAGPDGEDGTVAPRNGIERELARLWEELLGFPVGVTIDFFAAGGHSLLAVRLMAAVERSFGRPLPLAELYRSGTIAGLAATLAGAPGEHPDLSLVPLRSAGALPPLFLVHPAGGGVQCYQRLARLLPPEQPCYGLKANGLEAGQSPHQKVEDMARFYLEAVERVQPEGPYRLGGWSFGGVVAFEMARQLEARGQALELVVLFDSPTPEDPGAEAEADAAPPEAGDDEAFLLAWLARDAGLAASEEELAPLASDERMSLLARRAVAAGLISEREVEAGIEHTRRVVAVLRADGAAARRYRPGPFGGRIVLFRTPDHRGRTTEPTRGWHRWAAEVDVRPVQARHRNLMEEPHVDEIARSLAPVLEDRSPVARRRQRAAAGDLVETSAGR